MSLSYNAVICNYQRQRHHSKSGGRGSVKKKQSAKWEGVMPLQFEKWGGGSSPPAPPVSLPVTIDLLI